MAMSYPPTSGYDLRGVIDSTLAEADPWLRVPDPLPKDTVGYLPFTVDFYLYATGSPTSAAGVLGSIREGNSWSDSGINFYVTPSVDLQYAFTIDGTQVRLGNLTIGAWVHIALVYDGADMHLYVDSVLLGTAAKSGTNDPGAVWFHAIWHGGAAAPAPAIIANLRFWDHARTQTQIADDMNTDYSSSEPGLLVAYRMDSGNLLEPAEVGTDKAVLPSNATPDLSVEDESLIFPAPYKGLNNGLVIVGESQEDPRPDYPGEISGVVTVKGDPASQRVMALERSTGKKVAETTSAEDGTYTLTGLDPDVAHVIVALDKNLEYNGVIADNITPEVPA